MRKTCFFISTVLMLTFTSSLSFAGVIHVDITPDVTTTLDPNGGFFNMGSESDIYAIDFDNDGNIEFNFRWDDWTTEWFMHMQGLSTNAEFILNGTQTNPYGGRYINPLSSGFSIDATGNWGNSTPEPFIGDSYDPNFQNMGDQYVGVRFEIGGNLHYGWVLISFDASKTLIIKEYAYEDVANVSILAGATSGGAPSSILVNSITVGDQGGASIITTQGGTLQMSETVLPTNADDNSVSWSVTNGTGSATISAAGLLTATTDGTVTVTATANDASGVTGSTVITISNQTTGISNNESLEFSIYPNPVTDVLTINNELSIDAVISVYSIAGNVVLSSKISEQNNTIAINFLESGTYFLHIKTDNGETITRKIIKE